MKNMKVLLFLILSIFSINSIAQNNESIIGNYRGNDASYFIQKNNTFIIVGYATLITGKWSMKNNNTIILTPKNQEFPFLLYGFHNPSVMGTKVMFSGFDDDENFIGLNNSNIMQQVFNENANCTKFPNVYSFDKQGKEISFAYSTGIGIKNETSVFTFKIENDFNDFVAYYFSRSKLLDPITLKIKKQGLENEYGEKLQKIKELNQEDLNMIKNINVVIEKKDTIDAQYYNSKYNHISADKINIKNYTFNKAKNAYFLIKPQVDKDEYHNLNILQKYNRIRNLQIVEKKIIVAKKTLFHFECDEVKEDDVWIK